MTTVINNNIAEQLQHLPDSPGVYLMKDKEGTILYVGKATSLRNRVSSYFSRPPPSTKIRNLVERVCDLDFYITATEPEALILELNLIKRHRPRYNVRLKDDKTFPYLKISTREDWPRVYITRRLDSDGAYYFGPFASALSVRQTLKAIKELFPFRNCTKTFNGKETRACLWHDLGKCPAPCIGAISRQEYTRMIKQIVQFLQGKQERVIRQIEQRMKRASDALDFEEAAHLRDQVQSIQRVIKGQKIATIVRGEQDVIAFTTDKDEAYVQVFCIRNSRIIGREKFVLQGTQSEEPVRIMNDFIKQFYDYAPYIPPMLLLQHPVEDPAVIAQWLRNKKGGRVSIQVPSRGRKKQLVDIVAENAKQGHEQIKLKQLSSAEAIENALEEIRTTLDLPEIPSRIEGYDISNIQGKSAVGSMVVFNDGRPAKAYYRRFRIKTVEGIDDYAMLGEVLKRRFRRNRPESTGQAADSWQIPDLVLIDGGKGHLNTALTVMTEIGVNFLPAISLAKQNEELFLPGKAEPVVLPGSSTGLQLLQRIRDEAHRFAIGYFARVHKKQSFASALDNVPGIGPKRKRALIKQFGSVNAIKQASIEEVAATRGLNSDIAKKIKEYL
jgi:excinuclease ABC subunit C